MSVIIVFVLLGKIIESKAKFSAKDALLQLTRALPRRGRKYLTDGSTQFVPIKDLSPGDFILALTGEKIVLDGLVQEGEGACSEAVMTGESIPILKQPGSPVLAGSFLQQGRLVIKVTAKSEETALQRMIEMVEREMGYKSQYVRLSDQIVRWFVPLIIALASLTGMCIWWQGITDNQQTILQTAIIRAVSVLLISCPCAIGIAAPLVESRILNALAKWGALVRNRGALAFLGRETVFVCDKTGTLTEGKFTVLKGLESLSFHEKKRLKGLVSQSNHPIAVAINQALLCPAEILDQIEEIVGRGMKGRFEEEVYYLGSIHFLQQAGIKNLPKLTSFCEEQLVTMVFFGKNETFLTHLMLGDEVREEAKALIASFKGIKTILISGDHPATVEKVANLCGFQSWQASAHPLQKRDLIEELRQKGEIVAMLGDGVNDAPAITAAHVGMAVISATDISIQVSDLLLTTDRLTVISKCRQLAMKGHRVIKQNLFWAFFYNLIGIGLAMKGQLSPLFSAFAMVISSLIVLFNAQRIR
jgi:heavy metal translocating P-type ATPase